MTDTDRPARPSSRAARSQYSPLIGVVAVVLWVIGVIVGSSAVDADKGPEILREIRDNSNQILIGGVAFLIGCLFFLFFLGSLRSRLLAAEGGDGRLTSIAWGGGLATTILATALPGADMAAALVKDDISPPAAAAMHHLGTAFFVGAEYLCPALLAGTAAVALRTGLFPRWLAWISLLIALLLLIAPIGWAALIFAFPLWVIVVSVLLWQQESEAASVTSR